MLKITLITVGKLKDKFFADASREYEKRLSAYCKLSIVEITAARLSSEPSESEISAALDDEAAKILRAIPPRAAVVPMCIEGTQLSSEQLSEKIEKLQIEGYSELCFIIGGSYGLAEQVKRHAVLKLSMSKMTFPHRLARIMLLEQVYRAFRITTGGTYHK